MIAMNNLTVQYSTHKNASTVLGPISMDVSEGETLSVIGPSGCGKSTLLGVLSGLVPIHSGSVMIHGEHVNPHKHVIGFIPQNYGLLPWKTVEQNCFLGMNIRKLKKSAYPKEQIQFVLEKLDLLPLLHRYPRELSGGQQQRVSIARSFLLRPQLLLMDEPFSALDAMTREEAQELFLELWNRFHTTTLLVTHSIEEALFIGKRVAILSPCPGKLVRMIDNPLFGTDNPRINPEFQQLVASIRDIIRGRWAN